MKIFIHTMVLCGFFFLFSLNVFAQDEEDRRPVRDPFESTLLIDNQTVIVPTAKTLQFDIYHRFGTMENGKSDLWGVYAPGANIRMGLTYTLIEDLAIGVGYTKNNKFVDFNLKYVILKQTRDWAIPVTVTYYGNMAIDSRDEELFERSENPAIHRLSSFNEIIVGTRFNKRLSLQITPNFSYFNRVEYGMNNYIVGLGVGGRYKFSPQSSFIVDYNQQLTDHDEVVTVRPNIAFGWEISTSTHQFQIFASTFSGILPQYNMVFNENKFDETGILLGFNMTRLWNF